MSSKLSLLSCQIFQPQSNQLYLLALLIIMIFRNVMVMNTTLSMNVAYIKPKNLTTEKSKGFIKQLANQLVYLDSIIKSVINMHFKVIATQLPSSQLASQQDLQLIIFLLPKLLNGIYINSLVLENQLICSLLMGGIPVLSSHHSM